MKSNITTLIKTGGFKLAAFSIFTAAIITFAILPQIPDFGAQGPSLHALFAGADSGGDGSGGDGGGDGSGAGGDGGGDGSGAGGDAGGGDDGGGDSGGDDGSGCCGDGGGDTGGGDTGGDDGGGDSGGDDGSGCCGDPGAGDPGVGDPGGDNGGPTVPTPTPPSEPVFSAVCPTSSGTFSIRVTWNSVSGAINYPVRIAGPSFASNADPYINGSSIVGWGAVGDDAPTGNSYTFTGLTEPGTYQFWGHAWNTGGWSSNTVREVVCERPVAEPIAQCDNFTATPSSLTGPGNVTLTWATTNATNVSINNGIGVVLSDGSRTVSVTDDTTFTLTATRGTQTDTCTVTVPVNAEPEPTPTFCDAFTASPRTLTAPGNVTLTWATTNATNVSINNGIGTVSLDGSRTVFVDEETRFILTATRGGEVDTCSVRVRFADTQNLPVCDAFTATPSNLTGPGTVTLNWNTSNASDVRINNGVGEVSEDGSRSVTVNQSTTFVLTARQGSNEVTCSVPVTISNVVPPVCDAFTASPTTLRSGEATTLTWNTTNASNVSIDQGIGVVSADGSRSVTVTGDTTYTLTAGNGLSTTTCQVSVNEESGGGGGGGGGSSSPRCTLRASDTRIEAGERVTLSWRNTRTNDIRLRDDHGRTLIDTREDDDEDVDEDEDSIVVRPTRDTEYTLTVYRGSRTRTCEVEIEVNDLEITSVRDRQPLVAGISLSNVPYTGFEAGPFLTTIFYTLLGLWAAAVAYYLVIRRQPLVKTSVGASEKVTPVIAPEPQKEEVFTNSVSNAVMEGAFTSSTHAPMNLPTGDMASPQAPRGYEAYYETGTFETMEEATVEETFELPHVVAHEVPNGDLELLENRAHDAHVLMSTDALHFIMAQTPDQTERINLLDMVVNAAKANFPKEDGWVVVNKERILTLLA